MKFSYLTTLSLTLGFAMMGSAYAAPKPAAKVVTRVTRQGATTNIVVHDYRARPKRHKVIQAAPSVQWQEVDVRAPRLEAIVAATPRRAPERPVTWTQSYEPGPVTGAAANTSGSFGGSILPTQPYYGFGNYGYGFGNYGYGVGRGNCGNNGNIGFPVGGGFGGRRGRCR
jgi:hypothetical protein